MSHPNPLEHPTRKDIKIRIDHSGIEEWERCQRNLRWFVSQPENLDRYAGQVVFLGDEEVLGSGRDDLEALADAQQRAAQQGKTLPPSHQLFGWAVPPLEARFPEDPYPPEFPKRKDLKIKIDHSGIEEWERCQRNLRWFVSQPENLDRYAGQVVLLGDEEVLGSGRDGLEAVADAQQRAARQGKTLPPSHQLFGWTVPSLEGTPLAEFSTNVATSGEPPAESKSET
jgi:hypothetical protein